MKVSRDFQGRNESRCMNSADHNKAVTSNIYGFYCSIFIFIDITRESQSLSAFFTIVPSYNSKQLASNFGSVNQ